jgi:putative ABC transport system permease protein
MRPDPRELDDEIRAHLALAVRERIERGQHPDAARREALAELGYIGGVRESMRRVWYGRWFDAVAALARDIRFARRSLARAKGLSATVVVTLALGIGANAAIFSVVRAVLLRPLVNRDEDRLVYIRQSAPGIGEANTTFSVPEINDLKTRTTSIGAFGGFSIADFALTGIGGDPRMVHAGVVDGTFFDVMGLRPILGRLVDRHDDGPSAAGVAVLTNRFWKTALQSDPGVVGRTIRLGGRPATVIGVLEPSVPYPADTEIIANMVVSPHHMGALMNTNRVHRMTELFGRLAPGATIEQARAELTSVHTALMGEHPEAYSARAHMQISLTRLRDQITAPARTILLVLLGAAAVVFVIAVSNVANLILARSIRREGELAVRAALGAGTGALRRTLFAESLVLCGGGAVLGVFLSRPFVALVAQYAARFSVRAAGLTVDAGVVWTGAGLALAAAVLLAFVPRLPTSRAGAGFGVAAGGLRVTPGARRRLRVFATTQIALSFVLLAGASMLVTSVIALERTKSGYDLGQVVVFDIPSPATGVTAGRPPDFYAEAVRRIERLPGVSGASAGVVVPWRDAGLLPRMQFTIEGFAPAHGEENPHARFRIVSPGFFGVLGVPILAGRDFTEEDGSRAESVAIVSQSVAQRLFAKGNALNRRLTWTDPMASISGFSKPERIVGVVADVDDESVVPSPAMTVYRPVAQIGFAQRLFVRASGDPHAVIPAVSRVIREMSPDQLVDRAATLADVRAGILAPDRVNAFVLSGFAGIALLIAVIGIAGVLAFSVSARTREFGIRLAVGSAPRQLVTGVLTEGLRIALIGIAAGAIGGYALAGLAERFAAPADLPGALAVSVAATLLVAAAVAASVLPAVRASRVDVLTALRAE